MEQIETMVPLIRYNLCDVANEEAYAEYVMRKPQKNPITG